MIPTDDRPPHRGQPDDGTLAMPADASRRRSAQAVPLPDSIAGYRILGLLGEGAMGVVYEAEQQSPRRRVAIKVMRQGHLVDELHARMFQREAETLGRLKHPNIAAIFESGHTDDGHDFFAMELVQGTTLDQWLAARPESITGAELELRLRLFGTLCDAVHYAHQRGVIHRDLKPSNIIVTEELGSSSGHGTLSRGVTVKILDFGLARVTDQDMMATLTTEAGMIKGTLPYMSPEQARGAADEVDVRTDVYALGVILYEMVAGRRPYDISQAPLAEALRIICEERPRPIRGDWSGSGRLDADVETIIGKALEKEADRRYASAAALAEDVQRYLVSQPISARAPSALYQLRKFAHRHRALVGGATLLLMMLVIFAVAMTFQSERIRRERDRANREAATAREVSGFLVGLFESSDPSEARGEDLTARQLLDRGGERIAALAGQPQTQASVMESIGTVYNVLGVYDEARPLLEGAVRIREEYAADDELALAASLHHLATMLDTEGRFVLAEEPIRRAVEIRERLLGDSAELALSLNTLGNVLWHGNRLEDAERMHRRALAIRERIHPPLHDAIAQSLHNIGALRYFDDDLVEAERLWLRSAEINEALNGPKDWSLATSLHTLAIVLSDQQRHDEALAHEERALAIREEVLGPEHPYVALSLTTLGNIYCDIGRAGEAEPLLRRAVAITEPAWGPDHGELWWMKRSLAEALLTLRRTDAAEQVLLEMLQALRAAAEHPDQPYSLEMMIPLLERVGRGDEAVEVRQELALSGS